MALPKEITELIELSLTDGIITAKERQVILNKAAVMNIDAAEVELYIDALQ